MALAQLIYVSSLLDDKESSIRYLAESSRIKNVANGITGMLLCCDGNVIQILEGECESVDQLFELIKMDTRHSDVFMISKNAVPRREFDDWTTGLHFARLGPYAESDNTNWVFKLDADQIRARVKPGLALSMLTSLSSGLGI